MKTIKEKIKIVGWAILMAGLLTGAGVCPGSVGRAGAQGAGALSEPGQLGEESCPPIFGGYPRQRTSDSDSGLPVKYRYLLVSAQYDTWPNGDPQLHQDSIRVRTLHADKVLSWDHPDWSSWMDYPADGEPPYGVADVPAG